MTCAVAECENDCNTTATLCFDQGDDPLRIPLCEEHKHATTQPRWTLLFDYTRVF